MPALITSIPDPAPCLLVRYSSEWLTFEGVGAELSPEGLFVETELLDEVGQSATVELWDGIGSGTTIQAEVTQVHNDPRDRRPGMELRLLGAGLEAQEWIQSYCEAFEGSYRVLLAVNGSNERRRARHAVRAAGGLAIGLDPQVQADQAVARIRPHMVVVGTDWLDAGGMDLVGCLRSHPALSGSLVLAATSNSEPGQLLELKGLGANAVLDLTDDSWPSTLAMAADMASHRSVSTAA